MGSRELHQRDSSHTSAALEWFTGIGCSLAGGFVEQDAGGDRGVQAFDGAGAGNGDCAVGFGCEVGGDAVALVADEEGNGRGEVDIGCGLGTLHGG